MKCADCGTDMKRSRRGNVDIDLCPMCESLWVLDKNFKDLQATRDRFVRWLEPDLWSDIEKHEIGHGKRDCPGCGKKLHEVRYAGSDIVIDICPDCRGIWLHKGELQKIISYLEGIVDEKTISDYLKNMGHEAVELIKDQEKISDELKNLGVLMKLLEYRVISQFPTLFRIASKMPPV